MACIFINYRRDDTAGYAGRLKDRLAYQFGEDDVFMDLKIAPGSDFVQEIERKLSECAALIAVIGRRWASGAAESERRIDDANDFVRLELVTALKRGIPIYPVLVDDARMPREKDVPEELRAFTRRNALPLTDYDFHRGVDELIKLLERGPLASGTAAPEKFRRWFLLYAPRKRVLWIPHILFHTLVWILALTWIGMASDGVDHGAMAGVLVGISVPMMLCYWWARRGKPAVQVRRPAAVLPRSAFRRWFLLHRPYGIAGWVFHVCFYYFLICAVFFPIGAVQDGDRDFTWISGTGIEAIFVAIALALRWLAVRSDSRSFSAGKGRPSVADD